MTEKIIQPGSALRLHFALVLEDGAVVDSNFDAEPASLTLGDGNMLQGFEQHLLGLGAGAEGRFVLAPADAFGEFKDENVQTFKRSRFAGLMLEPGLVVSFADAANNELPGVVADLDGDTVTVDFNHPLAGKTLTFNVLIVEVL